MKQYSRPMIKPLIRYALMLFALLLVLAFVYDLRKARPRKPVPEKERLGEDLAALLLNEAQKTYQDPAGRFRVSVPASWRVEHPESGDRPYDVVFAAPYDCDLSLIVSPAEGMTYEGLLRDVHGIQNQVGINMNIQKFTFQGLPAIRREVTLHYSRITIIDFIKEGWAHEIQLAIPHRHVEQSSKILEMILEHYEPGPFPESTSETKAGAPATQSTSRAFCKQA